MSIFGAAIDRFLARPASSDAAWKAAQRERERVYGLTGGVNAFPPPAELTDRPIQRTVVLSDEVRAYEAALDRTLLDDALPPRPLRHTYLATPAGWRRHCDGQVLERLSYHLESERYDACLGCAAQGGETETAWLDRVGQWGE